MAYMQQPYIPGSQTCIQLDALEEVTAIIPLQKIMHVLSNPQLKTRTVSQKVLDVRMQQATASHNKQGKSVMKIHCKIQIYWL